MLGVLTAAGAELLQGQTVRGVTTVLLGDVVALLALRAGQSDLGANVGGLAGHVCLLVSILEHATGALYSNACVAGEGLEPSTSRL